MALKVVKVDGGSMVRGKAHILFFLAKLLPTEALHKALAQLCLHFSIISASTSTQLSKPTSVLKMWTVSEVQLTMTRKSKAVVVCIRKAGFELTLEKFNCGVR